jgi:presequence protease
MGEAIALMKIFNGFELLRERALTELNSTAQFYRHAKTGAELLSLINDDENKVFGITFRTPPRDSTGVAHILEHAVLCGSRKYPVKEPFVELMKGSLNTFLNAMTFQDKTCYPVASQYLRDFYNLIDVYLDAVFYPRLTLNTFQQEGWHYELDTVDEPLAYKGVVFNEMKGSYSSPDDLLNEFSQRSLFPDTVYGLDSGGDPRHIPDLTYADFKAFHQRYYHPSNARLFFYGDDDPEERLHLLDTWLRAFDPSAVDPR